MSRLIFLFILCLHTLIAVDYDAVFIGTSPIPLFEAIYQHYLGNKVLILEQSGECGGAWKSIDVCGVSHADLGCHQIGGERSLKEFLDTYGGCKMVSMDHPDSPEAQAPGNGFYFSKGCFELVQNLKNWIDAAGITLLLQTRLDSVYIDTKTQRAIVKAGDKQFTAKKIFYTSMSSFHIENAGGALSPPKNAKYPHLYLLIQDPSEPKFSYMSGIGAGASRAMNLSHFVGLAGTGRHLIVLQVSSENSFDKGQQFIDNLKKKNLLDPSAFLLVAESYTYELPRASREKIPSEWQPYFQILNTGSFSGMSSYIHKWKEVLPRYRDILPN